MPQTKPNAAPSAPTSKNLNGRSRSWTVGGFNAGAALLVGAALLGACGSDAPSAGGEPVAATAAGPVAGPPSTSGLSAEERDLLARSRGRTWQELKPAELSAYLSPRTDSTSAIIFWSPRKGAAGLRRIQSQIEGLNERGIRVALATAAGGNAREELIDLRESQLVIPAYTIQRDGDYAGLPGGELPSPPAMLIRSPREGNTVLVDSQTPVSAYRRLLEARAPE